MTHADEDPVVHILWMNGGLGCDGDSVALTAATQPSIEEIVLGALPGLPKVAVHWPLIDYECGPETGADTFIEMSAHPSLLYPLVELVDDDSAVIVGSGHRPGHAHRRDLENRRSESHT